ncbi:MAG: polysaccharide biosynthesis C-terminal domain-containing protein [Hydrococcus sp. Prado102]|jgi:O-antigen/teichoic acid export membrane protein|nr:polysaccharide biosynthesis C-terminal domain-containing protein [Hydrococcus sp. Prado102]
MKIQQIIIGLREKLQQPGTLSTLARKASISLVIQLCSVGIFYLLQLLFAQWMGADEYGLYEFAIAIATVLAFLGGFGLSETVLRFIPEYTIKQDWAHLRGIIWGSWGQTLAISLVICLGGTGLVLWLGTWRGLSSVMALILGIWTVPLLAIAKLQLEMARAIHQMLLAYVPSFILHPLLLMGVGFIWFQEHRSLTSINAIAFSLSLLPLILLVQLQLIRLKFVPQIRKVRPVYSLHQWLLVSLPLLFIGGASIILNQTDTLTIGILLGTKEVGIYNVGFKTAGWVSFSLMAVNAIAAPLFASLYADGNLQELQRMVSVIARWIFFPALLIAIGLVNFAEPILGLFGEEFMAAKWVMAAIAIGQLVNVGSGSVGYLLMMTGHHNQCAFVMGWSALINLVLNLILIPSIGMEGAALATAFSMALWNVWMNRLVVKYLGVDPSIMAALRSS